MRAWAWAWAWAWAACGGGPAGEITLGEGPARVVVAREPFDLTVELAGGSRWAAPASDDPALGLVSFGVYDGRMNPSRYYDPLEPVPGRWVRPGRVRSATLAGDHAELVVEVDPLVGEALEVTIDRGCDGTAEGSSGRCRATVRLSVRNPGSVAFTRVSWGLAADEALYGLGERFDEPNARGRRHAMQLEMADTSSGLNEVHVPVPWVVSTRGYAVLVEETRPAGFDLGAADPATASATFAGATDLVFHVVTAADPWVLAGGITALAGRPRVPPGWAFGPQLWRNELDDGAELLADAAAIRAHDLPVSVLWIDNPWQTAYNDFTFNPLQFPGAPAMIAQLHDAGYKVLVWSTPYLDSSDDSAVRAGMNPDTGGLYEEARERGFFARNVAGEPWEYPWTSGKLGASIDFTNPEASAWWSETARRATRLGIDGFKLDYGELLVSIVGSRLGVRFADGTTEAETHARYSILYHRAYRAALEADRPDGFIIGRGSTLGGQAEVDCIWPGDLDNDLSYAGEPNDEGEAAVGGLPAAVHALQSLAVSGFPTFGSDTGGYRGGAPASEVLVRWAAHTAWTPVMQVGGAGNSHNPWDTALYPEDWVLPEMRRSMKLHQRLFPYLYAAVCAAAHDPGPPSVMPIGLVWPDDAAAVADDCAYLLGRDVLVAPGCRGEDPRRVHLPRGTWVDWWSGDVRSGPVDFDAPNPRDAAPAFLRAGAIVPLLAAEVDTLVPTTEATTVYAWASRAPLTLRVVPPAAGTEARWRGAGHPDTVGRCPDDGSGLTEVRVAWDGDCLVFDVASADPAPRLELDWQAASAAAPSAVPGFTEAPAVEDVLGGTCAACWFREETTGKLFATPVPARICR